MGIFDDLGVVEFGWAYETGGASLMVRPLASEARANIVSDVHGVDHRQSALGASPKRARSEHLRWERRDMKAEIDAYLFCFIEASVPTLHNLL
jgi:hypothetical protein